MTWDVTVILAALVGLVIGFTLAAWLVRGDQ